MQKQEVGSQTWGHSQLQVGAGMELSAPTSTPCRFPGLWPPGIRGTRPSVLKFNWKFVGKELNRNAKKLGKEKAEKAKTKQAIQKGNTAVAGTHAKNAVHQNKQLTSRQRV